MRRSAEPSWQATPTVSDMTANSGTAAGSTDEAAVRAALDAFIAAFEQGDTAAMRASFTSDAVSFPRSIMGGQRGGPIDLEAYRRTEGIDPQMLAVIEARRRDGNGRPSLSVEPRDVDIRVYGKAALATFHLCEDPSLGRRTFVLVKDPEGWKIVHMHASNVVSGE